MSEVKFQTETLPKMIDSGKSPPLPSEGEVIVELKGYLIKLGKPTTPRKAYRELARLFDLTYEQQYRLMPNGKDVHWENRVRFARRKLMDSGTLDPDQPRGKWAINYMPKTSNRIKNTSVP